jgi:DNA processing protein
VDADAATRFVAARPSLMRQIEREWEAAVREDVRIVPRDDDEYPALLATLPDAPVLLYVKGSPSPGRVGVAVVGSRRATRYGREMARRVAGGLAAAGVVIVSGGARGIDTYAHRAALDAGGSTIAVLGCGFSHVYPPENQELFDRIAEAGAVLSEFPVGMAPLGDNFPRRNRLIAGLSAATVVVEATSKSGSLITAGYAVDQGREVMAVPGPVDSERSRGCHRLIQQGAKLVESPEDVLVELSPMYRSALGAASVPGDGGTEPPAPGIPLDGDEVAVLALFDDPRPVHVDVLADATPLGIARLQAALFGLALKGHIDPMAGGYYVARPRKHG